MGDTVSKEPLTILATDLRMVARWLQHNGREVESFFARNGIDIADLDIPRARIPSETVEKLLLNLLADAQVPCLGTELATFHRINDTRALGVTLLAATHGRQAL